MEAYIIAAFRTAVGKVPRCVFRFTRADDLASDVIKHLMASVPGLDKEQIDDVIVGNATPEAEQGLNIARMISLVGLYIKKCIRENLPLLSINQPCKYRVINFFEILKTVEVSILKFSKNTNEQH